MHWTSYPQRERVQILAERDQAWARLRDGRKMLESSFQKLDQTDQRVVLTSEERSIITALISTALVDLEFGAFEWGPPTEGVDDVEDC